MEPANRDYHNGLFALNKGRGMDKLSNAPTRTRVHLVLQPFRAEQAFVWLGVSLFAHMQEQTIRVQMFKNWPNFGGSALRFSH